MASYRESDVPRHIVLGSSDGGLTWTPVENPGGGAGGGAGTEYTEGATDATITGTAVMWESTSDTLRPVSASFPLPVNIVAGSSSGVQYTEGDVDATITGTALLWEAASDTLRAVSAANPLPISVATIPSHAVTNAGTFAVQATGTVTANAGTGPFPVSDNGGSLTVDAPVGTPAFVRLSDGSAAISTLPVSLASVPSHAVTNAGTFATQADTELPAAAALADGAGNPTTPTVGSGNLVWNGTGWDRARGDITNGVDVDVTRLPALPAGTNNIGDVDIASSVDIMLGNSGTGNATRSSVSCSTTSATLLSANANRNGATIYNSTGQTLYVNFQSTAATTSAYTVQMPNNTVYDLNGPNVYGGAITGILSTGSGSAQVTEW